ncbi:MAG: sensor histidine kinase [Acidobacteriota bacterium]
MTPPSSTPVWKRWRDWPWAARLALLFVTLGIAPLAVTAFLNGAAERADLIAATWDHNLQRARSTAAAIDNHLDRVLSDLQVVALAPGTVRFLGGDRSPELRSDVQAGLASMRATHGFESVYLVDPSGTVVISTDPSLEGASVIASRSFLEAISGNSLVHEPRYDRERRGVLLHASVPVRQPDGPIVGVAVGRIPLSGLDRILEGDTGFAGRGEFGVLWDAQGVRLSHPTQPGLRFRPFEPLLADARDRLVAESRYGPRTPSLLRVETPIGGILERSRWLLYDPAVEPHLRLETPAGTFYAALAPLRSQRWVYGIFSPESAILAAVREETRRALAVVLLTEVGALAFGLSAARWIAALVDRERQARQRAEVANRLKDEFLSTVSHELRTPLNAILGWTWILLGERLDPEGARRAVQTIERNARAQSQIIDDLLEVSSIVTGKLRLNMGPADLEEIVETAVDGLRPAAEAKGIRLELSTTPLPDDAALRADPSRLQQVVWNLLSNAVKFTPPGGRVEVTADGKDGQARIRVSDTGIGISPGFLPFVFDRFRQADGSTTRSYGGLGLGLSIVRHLVELHGGTVDVESEGEGRGAVFTVRLPLSPSRPVEPRLSAETVSTVFKGATPP